MSRLDSRLRGNDKIFQLRILRASSPRKRGSRILFVTSALWITMFLKYEIATDCDILRNLIGPGLEDGFLK